MGKNLVKRLDKSQNIADIFEIVKEVVLKSLGRERSGLMLGFVEMGVGFDHFVGAYYPVGSNMIVVNKTPIKVIEATNPRLLKDYMFHILLHEYLHTIGILDERMARISAYMISKRFFGENHMTTLIARDFNKIFPNIIMGAFVDIKAEESNKIEIIEEFEKDISYIG